MLISLVFLGISFDCPHPKYTPPPEYTPQLIGELLGLLLELLGFRSLESFMQKFPDSPIIPPLLAMKNNSKSTPGSLASNPVDLDNLRGSSLFRGVLEGYSGAKVIADFEDLLAKKGIGTSESKLNQPSI